LWTSTPGRGIVVVVVVVVVVGILVVVVVVVGRIVVVVVAAIVVVVEVNKVVDVLVDDVAEGTVVVVAGLVVVEAVPVVVGKREVVVIAGPGSFGSAVAIKEVVGCCVVASDPSPARVCSVWPATSTGDESSPDAQSARKTAAAITAIARMPQIADLLMSSGVNRISYVIGPQHRALPP
jgi:hypothetical protein